MSNISEHMLAKKYSKLADNLVNNTLLLFKKRRNKSTYKANQFIINHFYDPNKLTSINTTKHTSYIVPPLSRNTYLNSTKHQNITHKQQDHSYFLYLINPGKAVRPPAASAEAPTCKQASSFVKFDYFNT